MDWFDQQGVYHAKDPYIRSYFTNYVDLRKTVQGKRALIYWLKTRNFRKTFAGYSLGGTTLQQTGALPKGYKPQKSKKLIPEDEEEIDTKELLKSLRTIRLTIKDEKDPKVIFTKNLFFRSCYIPNKEKNEIKKIKKEKPNGNKFHDTVIKSFLTEYLEVNKINKHPDWIAKEIPNLMQKHVAYKLTKTNGFFNLSNQGSGKTLSAILTSLVIDSKYTIVVCPNNIIHQWKEVLEESVNGALVSTGKVAHKYKRGARNFHIINYNKFSYGFSSKLIKELNRQKYDFIILDETQNMKQRNDNISTRRKLIMKFLVKMNIKNPKVKKLCLTATPLINNVKEVRSLLQIITNESFDDLGRLNTVREASKLHTEFLKYSIRYNKIYKKIRVLGRENYIKCRCELPEKIILSSDAMLEKLSFLEIEQILIRGKMPEILKRVKGKTIIYTEWVTGITSFMKKELQNHGIKTMVFTGKQTHQEKDEAIERFLNDDTKVLIASSTIAEGFDKLQKVCSNMIFASLPFTFARYQHVIHRIIRPKQKKKVVRIHILNGELGAYVGKKWFGFPYDEKIKLNRLEFKKGMVECVTEGTLPEKISLPRTKIKKEILNTIVKFKHSFIMTRHQAKKIQKKGKIRWKI